MLCLVRLDGAGRFAVVRDNPSCVGQGEWSTLDDHAREPPHGMAQPCPSRGASSLHRFGGGDLGRCPMDGLQLDDHRLAGQFGYDPTTVAFDKQATGMALRDPPQWMKWRRNQLTSLLRELRNVSSRSGFQRISLCRSLSSGVQPVVAGLGALGLGGLIEELRRTMPIPLGFRHDLDQPALRKARDWGIPSQIGVLAGLVNEPPPWLS